MEDRAINLDFVNWRIPSQCSRSNRSKVLTGKVLINHALVVYYVQYTASHRVSTCVYLSQRQPEYTTVISYK